MDNQIGTQLAVLTDEIRLLRGLLSNSNDNRSLSKIPGSTVRARIVFDGTGEKRKPFRLSAVDGPFSKHSHKLTDVRAAILLVLLMDLKHRSTGGTGFSNPVALIASVQEALNNRSTNSPRTKPPASYKSLQVAISRLGQFLKDEDVFQGNNVQLIFRQAKCRLELACDAKSTGHPSMHFDISVVDERLAACLDLLLISPLDRVRQQGVLFVPGGPAGFDTLFLELFEHSFGIHEWSLYFKPSIITYPDSILDKLNTSSQDRRRKALLLDGFRTGRIRFTEILNRQTIREMMQVDSSGAFKLYGPQVTRNLVVDHLTALAHLVKTGAPHYSLILTDVPLPFWFSTFEIQTPVTEYITVLFRNLIREHDSSVECVAIRNEEITKNMNQYVIDGLLGMPGTSTDPRSVINDLKTAARQLNDLGPISCTQPSN
jgi:hypothetical protein